MSRILVPTALLFGLAAIPALAQTAPEAPTAVLTLQQNQRVAVAPAVSSTPVQVAQLPPVKRPAAVAPQLPAGGRRIAMADPPRR